MFLVYTCDYPSQVECGSCSCLRINTLVACCDTFQVLFSCQNFLNHRCVFGFVFNTRWKKCAWIFSAWWLVNIRIFLFLKIVTAVRYRRAQLLWSARRSKLSVEGNTSLRPVNAFAISHYQRDTNVRDRCIICICCEVYSLGSGCHNCTFLGCWSHILQHWTGLALQLLQSASEMWIGPVSQIENTWPKDEAGFGWLNFSTHDFCYIRPRLA